MRIEDLDSNYNPMFISWQSVPHQYCNEFLSYDFDMGRIRHYWYTDPTNLSSKTAKYTLIPLSIVRDILHDWNRMFYAL